MSAPPSPAELRRMDHRVWRACAGASVQIPPVDSRVYYFPQGHLEHASSSSGSAMVLAKPLVLCSVSAVYLLADPATDEVFARIALLPIGGSDSSPPRKVLGGGEPEDRIMSFAKILTPSDANNGGGFSVPRFCADSIFPALDYQADPPVQTLSITDVHGVAWEFRHIYRGTPRRHLLTTGWSRFVNHKKLVAGDSVVFMRNARGEMFVGVKRAVRSGGGGEELSGGGAKGGFSRSGKGRVSPGEVAEAAELAARGSPFEIVYYPRAGWPDFVVRAEAVEQSLNVPWSAGMRVKMTMETEDSSRMSWFQGTVSAAGGGGGQWQGSPWRMLQVTWDEPEVLVNARRVSPWQVELVDHTLPIHTAFPPTKRYRISQNSGLLTDGERGLFFSMARLPSSIMGHTSPTMFSYNTFPAGMQGARQNPFSHSSFSNLLTDNSTQRFVGEISGNNTARDSKNVSTELNIGSSQSENLSPDSQNSTPVFGTELSGNRSCTAKVGASSFQLFGKVIHMNQPTESNFDDAGCSENDESKGYNDTGGLNNQLDTSLTFPYTKLLDRLDVQCQRTSTVEACPI